MFTNLSCGCSLVCQGTGTWQGAAMYLSPGRRTPDDLPTGSRTPAYQTYYRCTSLHPLIAMCGLILITSLRVPMG